MSRVRSRLTLAFLAATLLLLAFFGATLLSFPIWLRYRDTAGLSTARTITQIAAGLTTVGLLVVASIVAIGTALLPGGWRRKLLVILPVYALGFTLVGIVLAAIGIGTVGPFIATWLVVGGLSSLVSFAIATRRAPLSFKLMSAAMTAMNLTTLLSGITWLAMVVSIVLVLTGTPTTRQGNAQGGQAPPAQAGQGEGDFPGGEGGPGRRSASKLPLLMGGGVMTIFAALELAAMGSGRSALPKAMAETPISSATDLRRETGRAIVGSIGITIVALLVSQLIPVKHDNPPAQTAVSWDSPQTQALAKRACMDCHSNETTYPWYAYVAPGSWLTRSHISDGRESMNLSALNNLPAFRASRLPEEAAQEIRSGAMPPKDYLLIHPDARLTKAEATQLMQGLQTSLRNSLSK